MKTYQAEIKDGIKLTDSTVAFSGSIELSKPNDIEHIIAEANPNQIDLFYMGSILVSAGWNGNDDVFSKETLWNAKDSPVDKQVNFMHDHNIIIGHITSTKVLAEGKVIDKFEDLPDTFDISVNSVIYRYWRDKDKKKEIDSLIAEIKEGKWSVSMECLLRDFDYAIVTPNNEKHIIARNEDTAYLTKYLRAYGGEGIYQDHKVGRLVKNITFSGEGLVNNPANKRSIIYSYSDFSESNQFNIVAEQTMTEQEKNLQSQLDSALAKIKVLEEQNSKVNADNGTLTANLKTITDKVAVSDEALKNKDSVIASLTSERDNLAQVNTKNEQILTAQAEQLTKIAQEKAKTSRLAKFSDVEIDSAQAEQIVDKFIGVSDEQFDFLVASYPKKKAKVVNAAKVLDNLEVVKEPNLSVASASVNEGVVDAWFSQALTNKKK